MNEQDKTLSKFLSLILRHKPETINLDLDEHGWANVEELIVKANQHNVQLTLEKLHNVVNTNDKKRFVFSEDEKMIRAAQGHSVNVDLQLEKADPPHQLFHGTALRNVAAIKNEGLLKGQRHHVHLSTDYNVAKSVGTRYGKPTVITINALGMAQDGFAFFKAENNVWLTDHVPPQYLAFEHND